jgi:predicted transcriptional regulator of viral defense system
MTDKMIQKRIKSSNVSKKKGYAPPKELCEQGFQSRDVTNLFNKDVLEKVQSGLYKLANGDITSGFVDASKAMPQAFIGLVTALAYYELTTFNSPKTNSTSKERADPRKGNQDSVYVSIDCYFQQK